MMLDMYLRIGIITLFIILVCSSQVSSQVTNTDEIIDRAESFLKDQTNEKLHEYFKYDPDNHYIYRGLFCRTRGAKLNRGEKIKGRFIESNVRFIFDHPEYPYEFTGKSVTISFFKNLNVNNDLNLNDIPSFIINDEPSPFISESELNRILKTLGLRASIRPLRYELIFDAEKNEHFWLVINTYHQTICTWSVENILINAITGEILSNEATTNMLSGCIE